MDPDTGSTAAAASANGVERPPRLPRWTRQEILVLIQGKKVAENRVRRGARVVATALGTANLPEPKWASVSSYCRRHGVNRGPVQCRKRWSNLAGDFRKIKDWESRIKDDAESFWVMRNDVRRENKLPGFFDREVYDILDGAGGADGKREGAAAEDEVVFDSGRTAGADEGLFSDFEQSGQDGAAEASPEKDGDSPATETPAAPLPISDQYRTLLDHEDVTAARTKEKELSGNPEKVSTSQEGRKRRRVSPEDVRPTHTQEQQLISVLEQNSRILTAQLEVQNVNWQLDREQRKEHTDKLIGVLGRLADALGRIADRL
ncbi:trihelix transcription factor ASR3-like isoform X2 [Aristolochia californica]|uniref:trihelix transcription factor ASR3-like isoform X2 n=1 Tax=Aristolochia californica TaxID=171875 RepID=UPI0035DA8829